MINDLKVYMTDRIIKASKVIVIPHNKPDFDAIGSAAGITLIARKFKKKSRIIVSDDIFLFLKNYKVCSKETPKDLYSSSNSSLLLS